MCVSSVVGVAQKRELVLRVLFELHCVGSIVRKGRMIRPRDPDPAAEYLRNTTERFDDLLPLEQWITVLRQ